MIKNFSQRKKVILSLFAVILLSYLSSANARAQTIEEIPEIQDDLSGLQERLADIDDRITAISDPPEQISRSLSENKNFFQLDNIGLWLLWIGLVAIILLLMAIRRNITGNLSIKEQINQDIEVQKPLADGSITDHGKTIIKPKVSKPLVKPVKIVKIKVKFDLNSIFLRYQHVRRS